jgi:hypothetical protein
MLLLADTHVHLYDGYSLDDAFSSAFTNLGRLEAASGRTPLEPATLVLFLAERHDCQAFRRIRERAAGSTPSRHTVEDAPEENALVVRNDAGGALYLVAGRQIVTRERLEVLALTAEPGVPNGGDILDTIDRVRVGGGVPVLAWAPGKWHGSRGRVVQSVLDAVPPGHLLVGDTSMRPRGWPTPRLMREAKERGFAIVAGTDPLPFEGQEAVIGRYGIVADAEIDPRAPVSGLRGLLAAGSGRLSLAGRRDSLASVATRLLRHRLAS